jgi:hypothetical protein
VASLQQDDFSGGIFRGRRAPKNSVYDAVNGLVSDEAEVFRRGGSEYASGSSADDTILGLWDGHTLAGQRTFFWTDSSPYVLDSNGSTILDLGTVVPEPLSRGTEVGGVVFFRGGLSSSYETDVIYAGSRKVAYTTGTASTTAGSATVTGSGTSWLANVDPGMIFIAVGAVDPFVNIVKSVESDTSLTFLRPAVSTFNSTYALRPVQRLSLETTGGVDHLPKNPTTAFYAAAGQRLIRTRDNRAYFSLPSSHESFFQINTVSYLATFETSLTTPAVAVEDYHELPRAAFITGADAIQDNLILFTTEGMWAIGNMALDAVDAFGNIQHQVQQISQQVILWGDAGVAAHENVLIIPAIDDVYAYGLGAEPKALSEGIRPLYREYVEAGYKPGLATVYRGHYILPILESDNDVVDTLVCRLDKGPAWTRWANGASGRAYARRVGSTTREPKLLGLDGLRVSDLTGCFDPDSTRKDDADGTDHALTVTTSDYPLGPGLQKGHCIRVRANYSLVDAASDNPTTVMQWSRGPEGSSFTTVTATRGGGESDGTEYSSWPINKAAEFIRFKWATSGAATSAVLRRIEVLFRPYGKQ